MKRFDAHALLAALKDEPREDLDGWTKTMDIVPLLGFKTLAGIRGPLARMVKAGFAEQRRIRHNRLAYRLSPRFKTWTKAHEAALGSGSVQGA